MALEMRFGGDRKQMITLGVLGVILVVVLYVNYFSGPDEPVRTSAPRPAASVAKTPVFTGGSGTRKAAADRRAQEFRPRVGPARPEERLDPMKVDPTLRLDLLARLEKVQIRGGSRSLFDFSNDPAPVEVKGNAVAQIVPPPKKAAAAPKPFIGPLPEPPPPPPVVAQKPVAPPIPLRFYGYAGQPKGGIKRAFFLDGEDIVVAGEGEVIKQRYKVVRIGQVNVTMEDLQYKQEQTLPIVPDNSGGA
jgi:hypothetical protein